MKDLVVLTSPHKKIHVTSSTEKILSKFICSKCDEEFYVEGMTSANCPTCGSIAKQGNEKVRADSSIIASLSPQGVCHKCNSHMFSTVDLNNCILCGEHLSEEDGEMASEEDIAEIEDLKIDDGSDYEPTSDNEENDDEDIEASYYRRDDGINLSSSKNDNSTKDLEFLANENSLVILKDDKVVATIFKKDMPDNGKLLFENGKITSLVAKLIKTDGLYATLNNFSAIPKYQNISNNELQKLYKKEIDKQVKAKVEEYKDKFLQCVQTAVIGSNKGIFEIENSIENSIIANFENEETLPKTIKDSFDNNIVAYFGEIFAKAEELIDKPQEVRNTIVEMVSSAKTNNNVPKTITAGYRQKLEEGNFALSSIIASATTDKDKESKGISAIKKLFNKY